MVVHLFRRGGYGVRASLGLHRTRHDVGDLAVEIAGMGGRDKGAEVVADGRRSRGKAEKEVRKIVLSEGWQQLAGLEEPHNSVGVGLAGETTKDGAAVVGVEVVVGYGGIINDAASARWVLHQVG